MGGTLAAHCCATEEDAPDGLKNLKKDWDGNCNPHLSSTYCGQALTCVEAVVGCCYFGAPDGFNRGVRLTEMLPLSKLIPCFSARMAHCQHRLQDTTLCEAPSGAERRPKQHDVTGPAQQENPKPLTPGVCAAGSTGRFQRSQSLALRTWPS